ncbi:hypothetical protein AB6813_21455 [bacterium RCC_150]
MRPFSADIARCGLSRLREALCLQSEGCGETLREQGNPEQGNPEQGNPEQGSAVVEFTFLSLLLMVPVVYFIVTIGQIQGGSFAVVGAADHAAKVYVMQKDVSSAQAAAEQAVIMALADYGHPTQRATIEVACDRNDCLSAGAAVTVTVGLAVPLPMMPFGDALRLDAARLDASATQMVGRFR